MSTSWPERSVGKAEPVSVGRRLLWSGDKVGVVCERAGRLWSPDMTYSMPDLRTRQAVSASPASSGRHVEKVVQGNTGDPALFRRESHLLGPDSIRSKTETGYGGRRESERAIVVMTAFERRTERRTLTLARLACREGRVEFLMRDRR